MEGCLADFLKRFFWWPWPFELRRPSEFAVFFKLFLKLPPKQTNKQKNVSCLRRFGRSAPFCGNIFLSAIQKASYKSKNMATEEIQHSIGHFFLKPLCNIQKPSINLGDVVVTVFCGYSMKSLPLKLNGILRWERTAECFECFTQLAGKGWNEWCADV